MDSSCNIPLGSGLSKLSSVLYTQDVFPSQKTILSHIVVCFFHAPKSSELKEKIVSFSQILESPEFWVYLLSDDNITTGIILKVLQNVTFGTETKSEIK